MANWEALINMRDELIGRDVAISETGHEWRGPLKDIHLDDKSVLLELEWSAEEIDDNKWKKITSGPFGINRFGGALNWATWRENLDRVELTVPMVGQARILPKSAGNLRLIRGRVYAPASR